MGWPSVPLLLPQVRDSRGLKSPPVSSDRDLDPSCHFPSVGVPSGPRTRVPGDVRTRDSSVQEVRWSNLELPPGRLVGTSTRLPYVGAPARLSRGLTVDGVNSGVVGTTDSSRLRDNDKSGTSFTRVSPIQPQNSYIYTRPRVTTLFVGVQSPRSGLSTRREPCLTPRHPTHQPRYLGKLSGPGQKIQNLKERDLESQAGHLSFFFSIVYRPLQSPRRP